MRFFAILPALFAATTLAAPSPNPNADTLVVARKPAVSDVEAAAKSVMDAKVADGCDILGCLVALAPASVTCAAALAEGGANLVADAACFAAALNTAVNPPEACTSCVD
ncbi:hypothetical protein EJ04DRAFT_571161 [Polyplosphaeria fusca]|uniref:Fungal calcium binding protein domain-containing protein n=1 Tax=Polyplosphaeria fusca TaxID=682080 RepID=A0A9P4QKS2_9PLEO|nr:hypothetical protein EJ04DRAFT_571161 [Polyplosphaeria fusca]